MHTKFWSENLKGRDLLEDLGIDEIQWEIWIGFIWPNTRISGGVL
jgi:hypothetical protein